MLKLVEDQPMYQIAAVVIAVVVDLIVTVGIVEVVRIVGIAAGVTVVANLYKFLYS